MARIVITGWRAGFDKIRLTKLLQDHAHLRLPEAKRSTDRVLAGDTVLLEVEDDGRLDRLLRDFELIGVTARGAGADQ
ncbi:MAG: hypothetical protein AB7R89_14225 [Dehalococcoidia bacterium]